MQRQQAGVSEIAARRLARRVGRQAAGALSVLVLSATVARAQGDSTQLFVRSGGTGGSEAEMQRVARQLVEKKRMQVMLVQSLQGLTNQLQRISDEAGRRGLEQQVRVLRVRLAATGNEGAELRRELGQLCLENRRPDGWLGIVLDSDVELKRDQNGEVTSRYLEYPEIVSVEPGSPAQKAGVEAGDRLLSLNNRDVRTPNLRVGEMLRPGAQIPMRVRRGLDSRTFQVAVERRPESFDSCRWIDQSIADALREVPDEDVFVRVPDAPLPPEPPATAAPAIVRVPVAPVPVAPRVAPAAPGLGPMSFAYTQNGEGTIAGASVTALNQELGESFGADRGLLVLRVLPGTPAEASGLRGGDVILSANGSGVAEPVALLRAISMSRSREVQLRVLRKKKPLTVALRW
ncbi:MAG: PDZ domain-containing protein [Gemmatimonadaceae bacterium]